MVLRQVTISPTTLGRKLQHHPRRHLRILQALQHRVDGDQHLARAGLGYRPLLQRERLANSGDNGGLHGGVYQNLFVAENSVVSSC